MKGTKNQHRRLALAGCPADCESCVNSETCARCRPGLYLLGGRCHHVCPEELEPNDKLMECTARGRSRRRARPRHHQGSTSNPPLRLSPRPVHCQVGEWSDWSPCARAGRPCWIKRSQNRTRQVLQYPSALGNPCPETSEVRECPVKRRKCQGNRTHLRPVCLCKREKGFVFSVPEALPLSADR